MEMILLNQEIVKCLLANKEMEEDNCGFGI